MKTGQHLLCLLLCCVLLSSCKERKMRMQMDEFLLSDIVIPSVLDQLLMGGGYSYNVNKTESLARMVIYTDSLACSPCRLQSMYEYNDILDMHIETDKLFEPIFVFAPGGEHVGEIENTLLLYRFGYPVLIDENGIFPATNPHIPADSKFHTFLLDKNGKVVLIGDPVRNPQLWELYKTMIAQLIENGGTMSESS